MKKAILLSYTFPPLATGGTQSAINLCKYLPENDWEVIPVTVENPVGMDKDSNLLNYLPENLRVIRVAHGKTSTDNLRNSADRFPQWLKRILVSFRDNYVYIPDRLITWKKQVLPVLIKTIADKQPHCIISRGPHHSLHLIAKKAAERTGLPFIPFFGDLWLADSNVDWPSKLNRLIESYLERKIALSARGIIATTEGSIGYFTDLYGDKCPPVFLAENAYDPDRMGKPAPEREKGEHLIAGWTGNFFSRQTPEELLQGFSMFFQRNPESKIRLKLAGGIDDESRKLLLKGSFQGKVSHIGRLTWDEVPGFQKSCDLLVGYLVDRPGSQLKNSRKTGEYLISGRSILGIVPPQGDMAKRILKYGNGYISAPRAEDIAIALEKIEFQWKTSTLNVPYNFRSIEETFSARFAIPKLARFLDEMAAP